MNGVATSIMVASPEPNPSNMGFSFFSCFSTKNTYTGMNTNICGLHMALRP